MSQELGTCDAPVPAALALEPVHDRPRPMLTAVQERRDQVDRQLRANRSNKLFEALVVRDGRLDRAARANAVLAGCLGRPAAPVYLGWVVRKRAVPGV